jgi:ABC-type amino acid transport substrate-binding protein
MSEGKDLATSKYVIGIGMVIIAIVAFAAGFFAAPLINPQNTTSADPIWDSIVASGKIRIGTDPTWPPFESLDNVSGNVVGFEVDLADAMATYLGLTTEWHPVGFDTIITSVQSKDLDMGVSGFSITAARLQQVEFTIPHTDTRAQVIMLQSKRDQLNITTISSLADLKTIGGGLTVGTQTGTTEKDELDTAGVSYRAFNDYGGAISDMASVSPTVDCVYAETPITTSWIAQYQAQGKTIVVIYDKPYYPCAFVVNKDAHTFLDKLNGAYAEMVNTGQVDTIRAKWHV